MERGMGRARSARGGLDIALSFFEAVEARKLKPDRTLAGAWSRSYRRTKLIIAYTSLILAVICFYKIMIPLIY